MELEYLGYNQTINKIVNENNPHNLVVGRVVVEHKERYVVEAQMGNYECEITGNLRYSAQNRDEFPAVGDWVLITIYGQGLAIINKVLPRHSVITRQAVGQVGQVQVIAANVNYAFLVQAVDRDFNINRLQRYLAICNAAKVEPIIVLTKTDLINEISKTEMIEYVNLRIQNVKVLSVSNLTSDGIDIVNKTIEPYKTYCMLGSSGVGKTSLINNLLGKNQLTTGAISQSTNKGRHVTTHRQLIVLPNGGIFIDNPGMRQVGIIDNTDGVKATFESIFELANNCKYRDCTHTTEKGCAVIEAVINGKIDNKTYLNFLKLEKEKTYFDSTIVQKRQRDKSFGKMIKDYKKNYGKNNF